MNILIFFVCALLAFVSLSYAQDPDANPCGTIKEEIPRDWFQGTVLVPEDPQDESSKKIQVFYYGTIKPHRTPVVFFNGGPGQHSHDAYINIQKALRIFDAGKDLSFIFIDQRGTGCSDFYPQGSSDAVLGRLANYGSRGIVADAEAIRKKLLGDKPWIIFGQSYGAHIVHRYVTLYPKSVKAAFGHGNTINSSPYDRFRFRIASQIRVLDDYLKLYPEDEKLLSRLALELETKVCFSWGKKKDKKVCGWEVTEDLVSSFLFSTKSWLPLHQWINAMADETSINPVAIQNYVDYSFEEPSEKYSKKWADRVISWTDRNTAPYDRRNCEKIQYEIFITSDVDIRTFPFSECASILQDPEATMDNWGRQQVNFLKQDLLTLTDLKTSLLKNPGLNFYLYSGQKDPFVPVESFQEELKVLGELPNLRYKNFPSTGHDGYQFEGEIWRNLAKEARL